ncbi:EamA family transporter [Planococcaceae bacterium Storch 2/2-2]|nr:EamA family transporter [Planococcaceae bacterium Storch 2/2-2]
MSSYMWLFIAIATEVIGSSLLKETKGFRRLLPTLGVVVGYGIAFYSLARALQTLPLGVSYAIWSGVGTAATAIIGWLIYHEQLTRNRRIGLCLIIVGVILLNGADAS